jgi:acyl-CoA thioesterase-1
MGRAGGTPVRAADGFLIPQESPTMKKVVLIGDSISMGYHDTVRAALAGGAEVWRPEANCEDSRRVLAMFEQWIVEPRPDVLHINAGLHDMKKSFGDGSYQVPLADYERNVREILRRALEETDAVVIWALTTPVNEPWHHANKPFDRLGADVSAYNAAARRVCRETGVEVNDLHAVVMAAGRDELLLPDGVHFGQEGCRLLGRAVAGAVAEHL